MNNIEKLKEQIESNLSAISKMHLDVDRLRVELEQLELTNWEPSNGQFLIDNGKVYDLYLTDWPTKTDMDAAVAFGVVRTTPKSAEMASDNMRRFNRLSCFMEDSTPILEYSPISVALVFYDYDMDKIEKLTKIIKGRGDL
jgi:hypothetical protein